MNNNIEVSFGARETPHGFVPEISFVQEGETICFHAENMAFDKSEDCGGFMKFIFSILNSDKKKNLFMNADDGSPLQ